MWQEDRIPLMPKGVGSLLTSCRLVLWSGLVGDPGSDAGREEDRGEDSETDRVRQYIKERGTLGLAS